MNPPRPAAPPELPPPGPAAWIAALRALLPRLRAQGVVELEVAAGSARLYLRRSTSPAARPGEESSRAPRIAPGAPAPPDDDLYQLSSPLTGVFYTAPAPHQPPYAPEGAYVEADQIVALIEAMKVFNEIRTEHAGTVVRVLAQSGQLVHIGQTLFLIRRGPPEERPAPVAAV